MTLYYLAFIWYLGTVIFGAATHSLRLLLLPAMIPLIVMACLRGIVGTDTVFYMSIFDLMLKSNDFIVLFEPLFAALVQGMLIIGVDPHSILLILATIATVILITGSYQMEHKPLLFSVLIVPYLYLELTMNTIRLGLAVGVSIWSIYFLSRKKTGWFFLLALMASQLHISSIMLTAGTWLLIQSRIITIVLLSFLGALTYAAVSDYINNKFIAYADIKTEAATAGLAPLILIFLTLGAAALDARLMRTYRMQLVTLFFMACGFFLLSQFTYAGLRFLNNLIILIYLFMVCAYKTHGISVQGRTFVMLFIVCMIAVGFRMRNYADSVNDFVGSPYTPYYFFWERDI